MKQKGSLKIVLFRFGLIILALLALHVLVTIYEQLDQASQILNELADSAMTPLDHEKDNSKKLADHFSLPNYSTSQFVKKSPTNKQGKFWQINPHSRRQKGERIRTRFHESVFSYERRFYEAHHTTNPTNFVEKARSPYTQSEEKYRNTYIKTLIKNRLKTNKNYNIKNKRRNTCNSSNNNSNNNNDKPLPSKVIIIAYRRSGSSFIGEMFNRNPQIFYLFEPIHPVEKIAGMGRYPLLYETMVGHVLDVIYTCSFNKHPFLVNFLSRSAFRLKSEVLKGPDLCATNATPQNMSRECKQLNATILRHLCHSKDYAVVKTIRTTIKKILKYYQGSTTDPKFHELNLIHLVRDPRAIISSRLHMFIHEQQNNMNNSTVPLRDDQNLTNALRRSVRVASANLCSRIESDLKYGQQANDNQYMLLRYEDTAMQPLSIYEMVSQFSGIPKSEVVEDWLERNTRVADARDLDDEYSTSRNSIASVSLWRRIMPYTLVNEVQSQCADVMKVLRYLPARNESELLDVTKPLVAFDKIKLTASG